MANPASKAIGEWPIYIGDGNYSSKYPKASDFRDTGVPFITASDFRNGRIDHAHFRFISHEQHSSLRKGHLKGNDVLIVTRGNGVGKVAWVDQKFENCNINAQLALLRADEKQVHSRFLFYLLSSSDYFDLLKQYGSGSAQPQLTIGSLVQVPITLPDYQTQVQTAATLASLDDKIELNRKMNETLEQTARAIFKSWFIDFDPVHAKAAGKKPFGMDDATAALFPDSFEKSELGEIPRGWRVTPLSEVVELVGGGTPKTSIEEYWNGNIPWFSVVDSPQPSDIWAVETEKKISQTGLSNSSARILRKGTTIISARGTVGNLALVGVPMAMNQSCYGVQARSGYGDYFVYFALKHLVGALKQNAHGSVFDTITRDTFSNAFLAVAQPGAKILSSYETTVDPLLTQVMSNLFENRALADLRDVLLPCLLSGELEIGESK